MLGGAGALRAEDGVARDADLRLEHYHQLGPFRVRPYAMLKQLGYDDNIFLEPGRREGDFTATLAGGAKAVTLIGRTSAFLLEGEIGQVVFAEHEELNHFNNVARAKVDLFLGPLLLYAEGWRTSVRERPGPEIDMRVRQAQGGEALGLESVLSPRIRGEVRFARERIRFSSRAPESELQAGGTDGEARLASLEELERTESEVNAILKYSIRARTSVGLEGSLERADFDDPDSTRNTRGRRILLRVWMEPTSSLSAQVRLGRLRLEALDREDQDFEGLVGEALLGYRVSAHGRVAGRFSRDAVFSVQGDNLFYITEGWSLGYTHHFTRRWGMELQHGREGLEYPRPFAQELAGGVESGKRRDDLTTNALSGFVKLGGGTRFGVKLARWERESTIQAADTKQNVVSTFLEHSF